MLSKVQQHVGETKAHLARRRERPGVVASAPYRAGAMGGPVHRQRAADRESVQTASQSAVRIGLDDQVQVVRLHRELNDPKSSSACESEPPPQRRE
jgi:hypothetical protein